MTDDLTTKLSDRLNETGFPFQELCYATIAKLGRPAFVLKEHPYTISNDKILPIQGTIDLVSLKTPSNDMFGEHPFVVLSIECKKGKPDIKNWCFIKGNRGGTDPTTYFAGLERERSSNYYISEFPINKVMFKLLSEGITLNINETVLYGYETNSLNTSINRNQEERIHKSILQAVHSCYSLVVKHDPCFPQLNLTKETLGNIYSSKNHVIILYIPVVVTTCDLWVANFATSNVNWIAGEIQNDKINWEKKNWVVYDFSLPDYLQNRGTTSRAVFIVNSNYFKEFYKNFSLSVFR